MSTRIGHHLRSNLIGYIALFLALGGIGYAAGLPKNSVKSKQIKEGAVKSSEVADDALTGVDVQEASLDLPAGPTGATGPQGPAGSADTAQQVLGKLLTVDGDASQLDADQLDGIDGSGFPRGPGLRTGTAIGMIAGASLETRPFAGLVELTAECSGGGVPGISAQNVSGAELRVYTDDGSPVATLDVLADNALTGVTAGAVADGSADHVTYFVSAGVLVTIDVWAENRPGNTNCGFLVRGDGLGGGLAPG